MASYDDDGEWHVDRANRLRAEAAALRRAQIDAMMVKVTYHPGISGTTICGYCGSLVGPVHDGSQTSHTAWHLFILEALIQ